MTKDIETIVSYWLDPGDGSLPNPDHDSEILLGHWDEENHKKLVKDMRGKESTYSLDTHGFTVRTLPKTTDIAEGDKPEGEYFDKVSELIKEVTGGKEVFLWGKVVRKLPRDALKPREFKDQETGQRKMIQGPSPRVHIDFAADHAERNIVLFAPVSAEMLKSASRWQILGVWTPTKVVQRDPFVLADARTVPDSDLFDLPRDKIWRPEAKLFATTVKHGKESNHQWYYLSDMTPDELFIFKHFDSKKDIPASRTPHTSIEIPGTQNLPARESVEMRAVVIF